MEAYTSKKKKRDFCEMDSNFAEISSKREFHEKNIHPKKKIKIKIKIKLQNYFIEHGCHKGLSKESLGRKFLLVFLISDLGSENLESKRKV